MERNTEGDGEASAGGLLCIWQGGQGADTHLDIRDFGFSWNLSTCKSPREILMKQAKNNFS